MESNGNNKGRLLTAGGVLSIIGGVLELIGGGIAMGIGINIIIGGTWWPPWVPWGEIGVVFFPAIIPNIFIIMGILILVLGAIGVAGGISALNRKSFGLSLVGAICILPTAILGILAVIFVALGKREFRAKGKGNGI